VLGTTNPDGAGVGQPFEVPVRAQVVTDCVVNPRVLLLARAPGATLEAELVALAPGARVGLRAARVEGAGTATFTLEPQADRPDDGGRAARWTLKLALARPADLPAGNFSGRLVLELDDPALPRLEVPLSVPGG
jgi:hypothetical protein